MNKKFIISVVALFVASMLLGMVVKIRRSTSLG